jgi:hypothetical protein
MVRWSERTNPRQGLAATFPAVKSAAALQTTPDVPQSYFFLEKKT